MCACFFPVILLSVSLWTCLSGCVFLRISLTSRFSGCVCVSATVFLHQYKNAVLFDYVFSRVALFHAYLYNNVNFLSSRKKIPKNVKIPKGDRIKQNPQ